MVAATTRSMMSPPTSCRRRAAGLVLALLFALASPQARAAGPADDMARLLAGLPVTAGSPLAPLAATPAWQSHAAGMTSAWAGFEQRHLTRVRVWAAATLPGGARPMFYMFGGPDFAHAEAFFPEAPVYVLSGLEPVGPRPEDVAPAPAALAAALAGLRGALDHFLRYGYFVTSDMDARFRDGTFTGTLPVLYVFLARAGKTIHEVAPVALAGGRAVPAADGRRAAGVRITFSGAGTGRQTLYYFRTDLSDAGVARSGFLDFCAGLGSGGALVKSASYLMHVGGFSRVRDFLLRHGAVIVQDDSGIPLEHFRREEWRLEPYGRYLGPTEEFKRFHQPEMAQLFAAGARPVNFGIGYRWHPQRTNILVAVRLAAGKP